MADFENNKQNETTDNSKDQLKQNLDHIQNEINQLTSNTDSSDDKIEGVDGMLTTAFADYLKKQDVKLVYALYSNVNNIIENSNGNIDPNLQKLKNFLAPLVDSARLEGNMDDKLSDEEAKEYKGKVGRIENLQETKANLISSLEEKIKKLDGADDNLKKTLSNIKAVVEQPNTVNVKSLQKFILKNLSGEDREKFFNYNFKAGPDGKKSSDNPDGFFGQNLVDGINTFLQGLDGYIAQVESSKNIQSENDEISRKQAEQKKQEEARKLAEQQEKERINNLNMGKIINSKDGELIKSLSYSIKNQIDDIIEIENSDDNDKNEKLGKKIAKLDSKLKKEYMDLFVDKVKAMEKGKPVEEYEKQLNVILKFGSWKIRPEDGAIIDDTDNISDYRKYANKIEESISGGNGDNDEKVKVPVVESGEGGENVESGEGDENVESGEGDENVESGEGGENVESGEGDEKINELNSSLKEALTGLVDEETLNGLKIIKGNDENGDGIILTDGKLKLNIDGVLNNEELCGKTELKDKLKVFYLAFKFRSEGLVKIDYDTIDSKTNGFSVRFSDKNGNKIRGRDGTFKKFGIGGTTSEDTSLSMFENFFNYKLKILSGDNDSNNSEGSIAGGNGVGVTDELNLDAGNNGEGTEISDNVESGEGDENVENKEGKEKINQLNSDMKEALNGLVDEKALNSLKIIESKDGIALTNGKVSVKIDGILSDETSVCGKNSFQDKIRITYAALDIYSQTNLKRINGIGFGNDTLSVSYAYDGHIWATDHKEYSFPGFEKLGITKDIYKEFLDFYDKTLTFSKLNNN